jgi:S-adenosyl methyltransferase
LASICSIIGVVTIDNTTPQSARIWNYWLGGKDHYQVDRDAGDEVQARIPDIADGARAERAFLVRVVRFLVDDAGIRQFLDIGTGLPILNNTHEVAQATAPDCRIVYVDNDPLVLAHARALLTSTPEGVATMFTPICGSLTRSWLKLPERWISASPSG